MIEPTLVYKRGEGWVYETHETLTEVIGKYRVTLVRRQPEVGEYYWVDLEPLAEVMGNIKSMNEDLRKRGIRWNKRYEWGLKPTMTMLIEDVI